MNDQNQPDGVSRRRLLGRAGVAAGSLAALPVLSAVGTPADAAVAHRAGGPGVPHDSGEFGRLFLKQSKLPIIMIQKLAVHRVRLA